MRTRFAPSPTGFLHVGGLRTALYAYLVAKQSKGEFIVRIEDTDQERSIPGATENILRTLHWAGLHPDEGVMLQMNTVTQKGSCGPYIQSERLDIYRKHAEELRSSGAVYPCFCTTERLDRMRKEQQQRKEPPMYDRLCCELSEDEIEQRIQTGEPYVLRLKVPRDEKIEFEDEIRGTIQFQGSTVDDQVLMKSDGFPTYHLAHVVDDHLMDIGMVIRGEEWLSSLPKHLLLFQKLGWKPPRYAHVPLLLNADRSKLSKRQNDVAAEDYIAEGYLPQALLNFLALLGWNPGSEQELFSLEELIDQFSLERVQKGGAIFDREKLDWLQGQWIRRMTPETFAMEIRPLVADAYPSAANDPEFEKKALHIQERITHLSEAAEMLSFFYKTPEVSQDLLINKKQKVDAEVLSKVLDLLLETLEKIPEGDWSTDLLQEKLLPLAEQNGFKRGQLLWPLRAALTGLPFSPGAFEVAGELGKEETLKRLRNCI